jgi:glycosyltransferase involved in cell wall biosynthesis
MPKGCEQVLKKVDCPVAMAKFGQKQVKDYYGIDSTHIPHGINTDIFKPLSNREELKAKWGLTDKFVIGVVARNQPRKNLDRTIKAMAILRDKIPNAVMLLHLDPNDPAQQMFNIPSLIQRYGLENRIIFTGMKAHKGLSQAQLNEVYNVMDVFLLTTSGEGFGIPIIEAMSAEIPVLATDYTTTQELVKDTHAGLGINLSGCPEINWWEGNMKDLDLFAVDATITGSWEVERGFCSIKDCATKLEALYNSPEERKTMGKNGRRAVLESYDFKKVGKQWSDLICS